MRKQVESLVAKIKKALFPTDDVLEAQPTVPEMLNEAEVITSFMEWQIDKKIHLKQKDR